MLAKRLRLLKAIRRTLAAHTSALADAIPAELARNRADTLAAEVLPLLAACKFLERQATAILAPMPLGRGGLPFWLAGVDATIERAPLGTVLIIAPANYPLFLPGVQALQALAAGNSVVWKPGRGGLPAAQAFADTCALAGLPHGALRITDESVRSSIAEVQAGPDKIFFTGSSTTGRALLHLAAGLTIPVVAELSGCDAVIVLPGADPARVIDALCFGMRLNGSATCMAPRRLILVGDEHLPLLHQLQMRFAQMDAIFIADALRHKIETLLADAVEKGGIVRGEMRDFSMTPLLVLHGTPRMELAHTDVFAPILTVIEVASVAEALEVERNCPFGLTSAIFGDERQARQLAVQLKVGTVLINDLIVPTADPRVPFGGRKASGFGATRGAEGLLEMTAPRTISARRGRDRRHLQPTSAAHEQLFRGVITLCHRRGWLTRLEGLKTIVAAIKQIK